MTRDVRNGGSGARLWPVASQIVEGLGGTAACRQLYRGLPKRSVRSGTGGVLRACQDTRPVFWCSLIIPTPEAVSAPANPSAH
jgi:hypothetical protein